jgi:hypothetical protein
LRASLPACQPACLLLFSPLLVLHARLYLLLLQSWSHDSFSDRGAYLITNSHPPTSNRPQADVLTAGRPITAALTPGIQLGVML